MNHSLASPVLGAGRRIWSLLGSGASNPTRASRALDLVRWIGWVAIGAMLCGNFLLVGFLGGLLVIGWTQRWTRALVLRGWARRHGMATVAWPGWFHEAGTWPGQCLWRNCKAGLVALACAYLVTGMGCALMMFAWEFGWYTSFHKVYEVKWAGAAAGTVGLVLCSIGMMYLPMAQAHLAVTGEWGAFFDFRFIGKLIRARLGTYVGLGVLALAVSLVVEILKILPAYFDQLYPWAFREMFWHYLGLTVPDFLYKLYPGLADAPDEVVQRTLRMYFLRCGVVLFLGLLLVRAAAAWVYQSAVRRVLQTGAVTRAELHPVLAAWFRDETQVSAKQKQTGRIRATATLAMESALSVLLFGTWFLFAAKVFPGEFFNYHPGVGFLNHLLIHFPCFDVYPAGMMDALFPQR